MATEHFGEIERLFAAAISRPAGARAEFLARTCPDPAIRGEVESLLDAADAAADFLGTPALQLFAGEVARDGWSARPGDRIASYVVQKRVGSGGMGEVWLARDDRLGRDVAIKFLLPHSWHLGERMRVFQGEARAAGSLNHPNVLTVYDVGESANGSPYLVTEYLEGEPLRARLEGAPLPVDAALDIGLQVARGLTAAQRRGIVHRDLKPENIFLVRDGRVKILDFGLATLHEAVPQAGATEAAPDPLRLAGTAGYMAPEQVKGGPVDGRTDVFALGAVLYEMLAGRLPFGGSSALDIHDAVLRREPPPLSEVNRSVAPAVSRMVHACLAKDPARRPSGAHEVEGTLARVIRDRSLPPATIGAVLRRPVFAAILAIAIVAVAAGLWRWRAVAARHEWARTVALEEARRLFNRGDVVDAYLLARGALEIVPHDPHLRQLWNDLSAPSAVQTDPPGARVSIAPYRDPSSRWLFVGTSPLESVRLPRGQFRIRVEKDGFVPIEGSASPPGVRYSLHSRTDTPEGMVHVPGTNRAVRFGLSRRLDPFWIDRFEVTNRQFKAFVDAGGYTSRGYWREPFVEDGRALAWDEAMRRFRDASGRPGPSTWKAGTYAEGQAEFPVSGLSWYEAAAFAEFAGKNLPTLFHWYAAARLGRFSDILPVSNFSFQGLAPVGHYKGIGPFGTYDMAGNVKEWCWTETNGRRFLLGGSWAEPRYMHADLDARRPFERSAAFGFRLVKYVKPLSPDVAAPVVVEQPERATAERPSVNDEIFSVYRRQHAYDRTPLNATREVTEHSPLWIKETVTFDAAYGHERVVAYLFLPTNAEPPFQTVVFFPAGDAFRLTTSRDMSMAWGDLIIRSGRAFLYPVYRGTYERRVPEPTGPNAEREGQIAMVRDFSRAIDYLETRADIDRSAIAFYGVSAGADAGVVLTALESRVKVSVLQGAGIDDQATPELDRLNYAPRVTVPTLMVNGRYDFERPYASSQRPLFERLGTPAEHKRHAALDAGHAPPLEDVAREVLPWLARYLGPVATRSTP